MSERVPWWKAFLPKWKTGTPKDTGSPQVFGADFDPFAQRPEKPKDSVAASSSSSDDQSSTKGSSLVSDDTYDDSQLESVFNEKTCRRNMKVSRSGRFKEKRRARSSLPIEEKDLTEQVAAEKEDSR